MTEIEALRIVGLVVSVGLMIVLLITLSEMRRAGPDQRGYHRWYRMGILFVIGAVAARMYAYAWALHLRIPGDRLLSGQDVNAWLVGISASWWMLAIGIGCFCRGLIYRSWRMVYARQHAVENAHAASQEQTKDNGDNGAPLFGGRRRESRQPPTTGRP